MYIHEISTFYASDIIVNIDFLLPMHKMYENLPGNNAYMFLKDYGVEKRSTIYHIQVLFCSVKICM